MHALFLSGPTARRPIQRVVTFEESVDGDRSGNVRPGERSGTNRHAACDARGSGRESGREPLQPAVIAVAP